jgi:hypothetical protein
MDEIKQQKKKKMLKNFKNTMKKMSMKDEAQSIMVSFVFLKTVLT